MHHIDRIFVTKYVFSDFCFSDGSLGQSSPSCRPRGKNQSKPNCTTPTTAQLLHDNHFGTLKFRKNHDVFLLTNHITRLHITH